MSPPNSLRAVPDVVPVGPGVHKSRASRMAELEARVAELEKRLEVAEQRGSQSDEVLRHVADLANSAALACNRRDLFAQAQLRALGHLAAEALESP